MTVIQTGKHPKVRSVYRVTGVSQDTTFGVHNNTLVNLRRGLMERVYNVETPAGLAPPPRAKPGIYDMTLSTRRDEILGNVPMSAPCTADEFVSLYAGDRRQKVYALARDSLKVRQLEGRDAALSTFVKAEKFNMSKKRDPAPRVIQPRSPRFNLEVGRYLKRMEKKIYESIAKIHGGHTVMKGLNGEQTGAEFHRKWNRFHRPVAVGLDASRFDQHVGEQALRWEHSVYLGCVYPQFRKHLASLLEMQIDTRGVARASDGVIKYRIKGCRMSGDMNTALGNCLLMCTLVRQWCCSQGVGYELANNGDDCVVIMESADLVRFSKGLDHFFLDYGFTMKVEAPVYKLEEIEFCQTHPVCINGHWLMVRDGLTAMAKDSHTVLGLHTNSDAKAWLGAIGECGMALSGGVPIFQEYYQTLLRNAEGHRVGSHPALESGFARLAAGMHRNYGPISDATRVSFYWAFGLLPSWQIKLEERLRQSVVDMQRYHRKESTQDQSFLLTRTA
jgi:hypothetical protein